MTSTPYLRHAETDLLEFAQGALEIAAALGSDGASVSAHENGGITVQARGGRAETVTGDQTQGLDVTLYKNGRRGSASTGELSREAIESAVRHAADLARFTGVDPSAGLADPEDLCRAPVAIDLFRPTGLDADALTAMACEVEAGALGAEQGIGILSAGASSHDRRFALATSHGFAGVYGSSSNAAWCNATAFAGGEMQGDHWQESERDIGMLPEMAAIGEGAARRAAGRLGARRIASRTAPVLFDATIANSLLEHLVTALSGTPQYQRASFLQDALGEEILSPHISIWEDPFEPLGLASRPFDAEGVAGTARAIVARGIAAGYFLSSYSARKLGRRTTGNASGPYNLTLSSSGTSADDDIEAMLRKLGTGLYLTGLTGQGVNMITGDYSRAGNGFWVEEGRIAFPVQQFTVAGNLKAMLRGVIAVGADRRRSGAFRTGSLLIDQMRIAGQ